MKRKILILILVSFIFVVTPNLTFAQQDPDDPGYADTLWITSVPMWYTWLDFLDQPQQFTIRCSAYTDEALAGFTIPISFYHSQNRDILVDSIVWSEWVLGASGGMLVPLFENDSVFDQLATPKVFRGQGLWNDPNSLPAGRGVLFTVYFNGDADSVPHWDTTKSIVLDTITVKPPPTGTRLQFTTTEPKGFKPILHRGVIGDTVVISGTAYQSDGTTPAVDSSVYCRGKEVYGSYFPGRICSTKTDGSGNFSFAVGIGGYQNVFRDTTGGLICGTNAFCFENLSSDVSGLGFAGSTGVEEEEGEGAILPENLTLFQNYPNPFNPNTVIEFALPKDCWVKVEVFNLLGQKVRTLADKAMKKGIKKIIWDGKNEKGAEVSSGIYFYRIKTDEFTGVKKMVLIK